MSLTLQFFPFSRSQTYFRLARSVEKLISERNINFYSLSLALLIYGKNLFISQCRFHVGERSALENVLCSVNSRKSSASVLIYLLMYKRESVCVYVCLLYIIKSYHTSRLIHMREGNQPGDTEKNFF